MNLFSVLVIMSRASELGDRTFSNASVDTTIAVQMYDAWQRSEFPKIRGTFLGVL